MKSDSAKVFAILAIVFLLLAFGCTSDSSKNGSGLMALGTSDNNSIKVDSNSSKDKNSSTYNNLNEFQKVKTKDHVSVNYTGKLLDGTVFDSSEGRAPLEFDVGAGQMIKGFDDGVIGMKVGEKKTITIAPEQAYGVIDSKKVITVDANSFPEFSKLQVGLTVYTQTGYSGRVTQKNDSNATVDFNHELAGKTLVFEITLVSIK